MAGLVVDDKKHRVANYHQDTIESAIELAAAAGLDTPHHITRGHISRRVFMNQVKTFEEIYPGAQVGGLLNSHEMETISIDKWS
jgi:hypothetical protein